jgi:hypothetical protein
MDTTHLTTACRPRGATLIEVVATVVITGILIGATTATVHIMARTGTRSAQAAVQHNAATLAITRLRRELRLAKTIDEMTPTAITFTRPDMDGDGSDDLIRYAWSGAAGDQLTRATKGGDAVTILEDVQAFELDYLLKEGSDQVPGDPEESAETLLAYHEGSFNLSEVHVHDNLWWAQYFKPDLPKDALSWKVTRVFFQAKRNHNEDYTTIIQLLLPQTGKMPGETVIDQTTMEQLALTDYFQWIEKSFTNATGLSPDVGLCLAFITYDPHSARLRYQSGGVMTTNNALVEGDDEGWGTVYPDMALQYYVYGTIATEGAPVASQHLVTVRIGLSAGTEPPARLDSAVHLLNAPDVSSL